MFDVLNWVYLSAEGVPGVCVDDTVDTVARCDDEQMLFVLTLSALFFLEREGWHQERGAQNEGVCLGD